MGSEATCLIETEGQQYEGRALLETDEIKCWGITDTPAFVGEPECNG